MSVSRRSDAMQICCLCRLPPVSGCPEVVKFLETLQTAV